jgi:lysophospholipase L1-like esterase
MKKVFFVVYLLILPLLLLEGVVRIWGYAGHYLYDPIYMPYEQTEDIPYIQKPDLSNARARGHAVINTDSLGLRSVVAGAVYGPKEAAQFRIAVTGDSVTFGEGVADTQETYPAVLESLLNQKQQRKQVQVFNFGVSAYSVRQMAATLRYRMPEVQPDMVVMAIVPEDFTLTRTGAVDKWGYTVHSTSTGVIGDDSLFKKVLRKIHLTYLVRDLFQRYSAKSKTDSNDTVAPGLPVTIPADAYQYVLQFRDTAEQQHLPYLVLLLPPISHTFDKTFFDQLDQDRIVFLDLNAIKQEFSLAEYNASRFDGHPSPAVHQRIAEELATYILSRMNL